MVRVAEIKIYYINYYINLYINVIITYILFKNLAILPGVLVKYFKYILQSTILCMFSTSYSITIIKVN